MKQLNSYMKQNKTCFLPSHIMTFDVSNIWVVRWKNPSSMPDISSLLPPKLDALAIGLGCLKWR